MHTRHRSLRLFGVALSVAIGLGGCSSSDKQGTDTTVTSAKPTTAPTSTTRPVLGPVVLTGQQELPLLYAQGVARIPNGWIFTGNNSVWKTDNALKELGGEGEGIDATELASGFLHVQCVDAKYVPVWFEHFRA